MTSLERDAKVPNVPAVAESYNGFEAYSWVAMIAPAKPPPEVLGKLTSAMMSTVRETAVAKLLTDGGFDVLALDAQQANKLVQDESARWDWHIKARNIAVD